MESIWGLKNSKRMIGTPWVSNLVLYDKTSQSPDVMLVVIAMPVLRLISSRLQIQAATESVGGHQPGPCASAACMGWVRFSTCWVQIPSHFQWRKVQTCYWCAIRKNLAKFSQ